MGLGKWASMSPPPPHRAPAQASAFCNTKVGGSNPGWHQTLATAVRFLSAGPSTGWTTSTPTGLLREGGGGDTGPGLSPLWYNAAPCLNGTVTLLGRHCDHPPRNPHPLRAHALASSDRRLSDRSVCGRERDTDVGPARGKTVACARAVAARDSLGVHPMSAQTGLGLRNVYGPTHSARDLRRSACRWRVITASSGTGSRLTVVGPDLVCACARLGEGEGVGRGAGMRLKGLGGYPAPGHARQGGDERNGGGPGLALAPYAWTGARPIAPSPPPPAPSLRGGSPFRPNRPCSPPAIALESGQGGSSEEIPGPLIGCMLCSDNPMRCIQASVLCCICCIYQVSCLVHDITVIGGGVTGASTRSQQE